MKAMTKKLGAVILALAMCLSLCCTALAAEEGTYTITVNGYTGQTYIAYKVFDATYSGSKEEEDLIVSYTIDSTSLWYKQVSEATDVFKLTQVGDTTTYVVEVASEAVTGDQIAAALQPVPEGAEIAALEIVEREEDESSTAYTFVMDVSESGAGYYFVTTTLGSAVAVNSATPNVTVDDKNTPPTVEKQVDLTDEESVENHRVVNYEFKIDNVYSIYHLVLEDAMTDVDEGVTYQFIENTLTVQLIDETGTTDLVLGEDYTVLWKDAEEEAERPDDGCDFHVVFTSAEGVDYDFSKCSENAYVYVTVNCAVDADDAYFQDDEVEIPNHAAVTYGNDGHSVWDEADIYEYAFHIYKYTGDIETEGASTPLADAHFSLTNNNPDSEDYGKTAYFDVNSETGDYMLEGWTDNVEEIPSDYTADLVSAGAGNIKIDGLAEGSYILTETQAPDGYNMLTSPITVTITADETDPSTFYITVDGEEITGHTINVENNAGSELPSTGGIGTTIFYIIGGVLVAGAVVVLITRRRMSSEG